MEKQQRTRLATGLILALVFGSGFVLGIAADRGVLAGTAEGSPTASPEGEPGGDDADDRERRQPIYEQVGALEPDQKERIEAIVEQYRMAGRELREGWDEEYAPLKAEREAWEEEHVEPLRREWGEKRDSLIRATRGLIKDVMTEDQARRYDSLVADYEKRRDERRRERSSSGDRRE